MLYHKIQSLYLRDPATKHRTCWCAPGLPCHADVLLRIANEPETMPDTVALSNKACPRYYTGGSPASYCSCPSGRCWYDEQKQRRRQGKRALSPDEWLRFANERDE